MTVKLRRPILVGGIGLSFSLWAWESWHNSAGQLGEWGVLGAVALGTGFWLWRRNSTSVELPSWRSPMNREQVTMAIAAAETVINQLKIADEALALPLQERIPQLLAELNRTELRVAVTGGKAVGKTTLMAVLASEKLPQFNFVETPALFTQDGEADKVAKTMAIAADLVILIVSGDLTDSEFQSLQELAAHQKIILAFNKQDQYLPEERTQIWQQLQWRTDKIISSADVVAIAVQPSPLKVRQHQVDGLVQEWLENPAPAVDILTARLNQVAQTGQELVYATVCRQAKGLQAEAKAVLNGVRRDRALPLIEQFQWISAGTAFANPVPVLDLLAASAINAQMAVELSNLYQQKFSLDQAKTLAGTMGTLMVKLGLVELSTQTIGSILKSNAITYVAGGLVQGVSAAYLTRLAGLSLVEYFQEQEINLNPGENPLKLASLTNALKKVFQENQRAVVWQAFIKQAISRLLPESPAPEIAVTDLVLHSN